MDGRKIAVANFKEDELVGGGKHGEFEVVWVPADFGIRIKRGKRKKKKRNKQERRWTDRRRWAREAER